MKNFPKILVLLSLMIPVFSYAQNEMAQNSDYKTFSSSANLEFTEKATATDLLLNGYNVGSEKDKCRTYRSMKTAGIVMTIAGSAIMAGGIAMIIIGANNDDDFEFDGDSDGLIIGGVIATVGGGATATAGIPLMIIGGIKSNKYCNGGDRSSMVLGANKNGIGAKLVF